MPADNYTLDNLDQFIGKEVGVSDWMEVSQQLIDDFSEVSGDRQWIHVDVERAATGPFGAPIAHGLLLLSLTVRLALEAGSLPAGASMGINYGFDKIRFRSVVKAGQRIRCRVSLVRAQQKGADRYLLTTRYTVEVEGGAKPACVADGLGLFYR